MTELIIVGLLALAAGALIGWLIASRRGQALASDLAVATARTADFDIVRQARDEVERERNQAMQDLASLRAQIEERDAAHARTLAEFKEAREAMTAHFDATAAKALESARRQLFDQATIHYNEAEKAQAAKLSAMLQPVESTLKRYEDNLGRIEKEREGSYRELSQVVAQLGQSNAGVVRETQRLANVMRSSPKHRGRWGEEQLRTILESAGLAENVDFTVQTTVNDGERQLRPDFVVNLPGERCIVIDVKCPLVHFEAAYDEENEARRADLLLQHANALKSYARDLGSKGYWRQFDRSPDYVIMFVPGEHFLSAAAERAPDLIKTAFRNGVLVASTINMLALAQFMAGLWRQEALREQAQEIADAARELYKRLATMSGHVAKLGRNLGIATSAYNDMVGSLESQVYTQAQRFEKLGVETSGKKIEAPPVLETGTRPLTKLAAATGDQA